MSLASVPPLDRTFMSCLDSMLSWGRQGGGREIAGSLSSQTLLCKETQTPAVFFTAETGRVTHHLQSYRAAAIGIPGSLGEEDELHLLCS